jgi:DNA-directed RNA polymerase delta subunit
MGEDNKDAIERHERWLAEHEAMIRKFDENLLEIQAIQKTSAEEMREQQKLFWASLRSTQRFLKLAMREGDARLKAFDAKLDRLADLMIGHYGGNGDRRPRA